MNLFYSCLQKALEKNDVGDHFPVLGINLGGNLLIKIVADVSSISKETLKEQYVNCYKLFNI